MRKVLIGFSIVAVILLLSGLAISIYIVQKSFPQTEGELAVAGLEARVDIYRDNYGVPHLYASSEHDVYFAVGFVHAQERLWQMEVARRAGLGRLAEALGSPALKIDRMFRTLGLRQQATRLAQALDAKTRAALQAYADGVNAFIVSAEGSYPLEFDMLGITPEPWAVEHSLLISRLMAWELNYSRWVDLTQLELVRRFGEERAREIFPHWPAEAPLIVTNAERLRKATGMLRGLTEADGAFRALMGGPGFGTGSNAWAVSGSKTITGKPMLANDPHLILMTPGRWFELHSVAPELDVAGTTIPGIPFVVIGRNARIAWGVTNAMLDDDDFYLEEVDSLIRPTKYRVGSEWRPISERVDTILVKDELPVLLTVYSTHRGPIINRMEPGAVFTDHLVSMRWVGHDMSEEAAAFSGINRAGNWEEFTAALKKYGAPAQNFVYADIDGNIGYQTGGRIPMRSPRAYTLPMPGTSLEHDWTGFVPFESNPRSYNPPSGYIATANNRIVDESYPYHISNHYEPPWRAERLNEVLSGGTRFTLEDMRRLQQDLYSTQARAIVPIILAAFDSVQTEDADLVAAFAYFRNWTYEMRSDDVSTSLFQATFDRIVANTLHDELGPELAALYDTLASVPFTVVTELLKQPQSSWFDDVRTPERETRDAIIRRSLGEAIGDLRDQMGGQVKDWQWGSIHQVRFNHVFGAHPILARVFNIGPFPVGGAHSTVNVSQYFLSAPFDAAVGPSTRQLFDLSDRNATQAVTPPGQSGQVFSRHYADQIQLWLNGGMRGMPMERSIVERSCKELLTLMPAP